MTAPSPIVGPLTAVPDVMVAGEVVNEIRYASSGAPFERMNARRSTL